MATKTSVRTEIYVSDNTVKKLHVIRAMLLALTGPHGVEGLEDAEIYTLMDDCLQNVCDVLRTITKETNKSYRIAI